MNKTYRCLYKGQQEPMTCNEKQDKQLSKAESRNWSSLPTYAPTTEPTWWKDRTDSHELSSSLHTKALIPKTNKYM